MYKLLPIVEARQWPCESKEHSGKAHPGTCLPQVCIWIEGLPGKPFLLCRQGLALPGRVRGALHPERHIATPHSWKWLWHSRKGSFQHQDGLCNMQIMVSYQMCRLMRCRGPWGVAACGYLVGTIHEGREEQKPVPFSFFKTACAWII